jgi:hypothetical protein
LNFSSPNPSLSPKNFCLLFLIFTLSNALLAYAPLDVFWQWTVGILGLTLPWCMGWFFYRKHLKGSKDFSPVDWIPAPSFWVVAVLFLAAGFLRFTQLTTLSLWPLTDEAKSAYYSLQLAAHGSFQMLYDFSQLPPLYIWLQGIFFRVFGVSLSSLWFLPAVLSLLTVVAAYFAARAHMNKTFALFFCGLMAFSFWPLYVGRFSHQGSLLLLWEVLVFGAAGQLVPAAIPGGREKFGFGLGFLAGLGFYTFTSWPTVALVLALWIFFFHRKAILPFCGGMILAYLPLGWAWLHQDYGGYIHHVWAWDPARPLITQLIQSFSDFSAFFWKSTIPSNLFAYKPFWGGYLNPILGALFFLGALVFFRTEAKSKVLFAISAFVIFYLPGFLTGGVEMFRVLPLLPLLLAGVAWGFLALLEPLKSYFRWIILALILILSLGLDVIHLFGAYHGIWTHPHDNWFASKSVERLRGYQILGELQKQEGPGFVLSELVPDLYDQSLSIATYTFNVEQNPKLNAGSARWVALLINVHYQPYLAGIFPEGRWYRLAPDVDRPDGGLMLAIFPLPSNHPETLNRWIGADRACHDLTPLVFDDRDYKSRKPIFEKLYSLYPLFEGDRFLESCFWEKIAENEYGDRNYGGQIDALKQAIEKGYPTAHLYNDLGALFLRRSRFQEAHETFEKALKCNPNYTSAAAGLLALEEAEKTGKLPRD